MPAAERHQPPQPLLLFLPSLLLISCLDGAARAAAASAEEGGGLPGDNGLAAAVGDPAGTDTAVRSATISALEAGKHKQRVKGKVAEGGRGWGWGVGGCHCY